MARPVPVDHDTLYVDAVLASGGMYATAATLRAAVCAAEPADRSRCVALLPLLSRPISFAELFMPRAATGRLTGGGLLGEWSDVYPDLGDARVGAILTCPTFGASDWASHLEIARSAGPCLLGARLERYGVPRDATARLLSELNAVCAQAGVVTPDLEAAWLTNITAWPPAPAQPRASPLPVSQTLPPSSEAETPTPTDVETASLLGLQPRPAMADAPAPASNLTIAMKARAFIVGVVFTLVLAFVLVMFSLPLVAIVDPRWRGVAPTVCAFLVPALLACGVVMPVGVPGLRDVFRAQSVANAQALHALRVALQRHSMRFAAVGLVIDVLAAEGPVIRDAWTPAPPLLARDAARSRFPWLFLYVREAAGTPPAGPPPPPARDDALRSLRRARDLEMCSFQALRSMAPMLSVFVVYVCVGVVLAVVGSPQP